MKTLKELIVRMAMAVVMLLCGVVAGYAQPEGNDPTAGESNGLTTGQDNGSTVSEDNGQTESNREGPTFKLKNMRGLRYSGYFIYGIDAPVKDLVIPQTVVVDGKSYDITGVTENAFIDMTELETVTFESTYGCEIHACAFRGCSNLREVNFNGGTVIIGSEAFINCTSLAGIDLRRCDAKVFMQAFKRCPGIRNILFNDVEIVWNHKYDHSKEEYAFALFDSTTDVDTFEADRISFTDWEPTSGGGGVTSGLTSTISTSSVTAILPDIFGSIKNIKTLKLPRVEWYRANALNGMTIDNLVTSKYSMVYFEPDALKDATIRHITTQFSTPPVFKNSDGSELDIANITLTVPQGCLDNYMRSPYWSKAVSITEDETIVPIIPSDDAIATLLNGNTLYGVNKGGSTLCYGLPTYSVDGYKVKNYGTARLAGSISEEGVGQTDYYAVDYIMPDEPVEYDGVTYDVTEVAPYAAANYSRSYQRPNMHWYEEFGMSKIRLSDRCERIGQHAFEAMRFMQEYGDEPELDFGEGLREIGAYAFSGAEFGSFDTLELPATLESIGAHTFDGSKGIRNIVLNAVTPPATDGDALFTGARKRSFISLYVPDEAVEAYRSAPVWSDFNISPLSVWGGVQSVVTDTADAPAVYYNLQGIRIDAPSHGIYIRRAADGTSRLVRL